MADLHSNLYSADKIKRLVLNKDSRIWFSISPPQNVIYCHIQHLRFPFWSIIY